MRQIHTVDRGMFDLLYQTFHHTQKVKCQADVVASTLSYHVQFCCVNKMAE